MKNRLLSVFSFLLIFSLLPVFSGPARAAGGYTHPSAAFSISEFGALQTETENGALFVEDGALLMVQFGPALVTLTPETLPDILSPILDGIQEFDGYELYAEDIAELDYGYVIFFEVTPAEAGSQFTGGSAYLAQDGDLLYLLLLLTDDYDAVAASWEEAVGSFVPASLVAEEDIEPVKPTKTPAAPKATPTPAAAEGDALSGFDPQVDGFGFENYGNEMGATNLTPEDMQRMFGDRVCASMANGGCTLTPPAHQWMGQINNYMDGGHCEGMAVLSALMYYDQVNPIDFGSKIVHNLELDGNEPLQREIAFWWTTQSTYPGAAVSVSESPSAVLDTLMETFAQGKQVDEWWAMGFYNRDGSDGHAVTPIGVEAQGKDIYNILIYDNNFPGETRIVEVNRKTDTWQYEGSPNPEVESFLYEGDADSQNLEIVAISPRLQTQECDFCSGAGAANDSSVRGAVGIKGAAKDAYPAWQDVQQRWALLIDGVAAEFYQIWLTGDSALLIVDNWGRRIGFDAGEFVDEIPGASTQHVKIFFPDKAAGDSAVSGSAKSPVFRMPVGLSFSVVIDGSDLAEGGATEVAMIGPGYYLNISDLWMEPGDVESVGVHIDKSRRQLTYMTEYSVSPWIEMGLEKEDASYAFMVTATELVGAEDTFDVILDMATDEFILNTSYNTDPSVYQVYVLRIDEEGERVFGYDEIQMDPENTFYIPFSAWEGEGSGLILDFDYENDGQIDDTFELPDVTDTFDFYEGAAY